MAFPQRKERYYGPKYRKGNRDYRGSKSDTESRGHITVSLVSRSLSVNEDVKDSYSEFSALLQVLAITLGKEVTAKLLTASCTLCPMFQAGEAHVTFGRPAWRLSWMN